MRTRFLAAIVCGSLLPAVPALAQDLGASMMQQYREQMRPQQDTLHNDARDYRDLSSAQLTKIFADYWKETEPHRQNALQIAEQARTSALPPGSGARIREALDADLTLWYNSLPVSKSDGDTMRNQWLVPAESLTDQQWAQRRADWFTARDAWMNKRMETAKLVRH